MKRMWLGWGILALFLALGLWGNCAMARLNVPLRQDLETAAQTALSGDLAGAMYLAQTTKDTWDRHWHRVALLADHTPMDEIDKEFAQLLIYGQAGQVVPFAAHCAQLSELMEAVAESHAPTWWNLL